MVDAWIYVHLVSSSGGNQGLLQGVFTPSYAIVLLCVNTEYRSPDLGNIPQIWGRAVEGYRSLTFGYGRRDAPGDVAPNNRLA